MSAGTSNAPTRRFGSDEGAGVPQLVDEDPVVARTRLKSAPHGLGPGSRVGRYVIQRQLGRGGMGVVYGAVDPELGRRVAIKLVRWADRGAPLKFTARLRREAQALARISHPNIVALYDLGTTSRGSFMAMEYLHGQSLRQWLRYEVRPWKEVLMVLLAAGRGLAAAHAAGVIHRDFKPTNVMVGDGKEVKVLDFGLARGTPTQDPWLDANTEDLLSRRMTRADVVVGTTGYMAPEQLLGGEVGPWSDQFSFCVTLYEALYGVRPYPGENPIEVAAAFNQGRLVEPEDRRGVPPRVHEAVLRGLSVDPEERFGAMDNLLSALEAEIRTSWRTRLGIAALACFLTASIAGGWLWARRTPEPQPTGPAPVCTTPSETATPSQSATPEPAQVRGSDSDSVR